MTNPKHTDTSRSGDLVEGEVFFKNGKIVSADDIYLDPRDALIETQAREIERLCDILEQWLNTAREHLDTEVAGRTFEALRKNSHD